MDEWSAQRTHFYLTTHNIHKRQTSMPPVGFEPTIPAIERPKTHVLYILRLPWLRFFRAFSSVVRQMPGLNSQRRGKARKLPNWLLLCCSVVICAVLLLLCCSVVICAVLLLLCCTLFVLFCYYLCCSMYFLFVNVYCTTATGFLPNCSWQIYELYRAATGTGTREIYFLVYI
jgi:hypothetical protein